MPRRGRTALGDQRDPAQPEEVAAVAEDELVHHGQRGEPGEHQHHRLGNRPGRPRGEQQGVHDDEVEEVAEPAGQQGEGPGGLAAPTRLTANPANSTATPSSTGDQDSRDR